MRAWVVWTSMTMINEGADHCGLVVYAETRGKARAQGGAEMNLDFQEAMALQVLRAPLADPYAETRRDPPPDVMEALGFWPGEPGVWTP